MEIIDVDIDRPVLSIRHAFQLIRKLMAANQYVVCKRAVSLDIITGFQMQGRTLPVDLLWVIARSDDDLEVLKALEKFEHDFDDAENKHNLSILRGEKP